MIHRMLGTWIVACGLVVMPVVAGADIFMLIQGVAGDATDPAHKGWIRVSSIDWGARMPVTTSSSGGGATVGRASGEIVKLAIPTGAWSKNFLQNLTRGTPFSQVVIDHVNSDGRPSYRVTFGTFFVTQYHNASTARTPAQDELEATIGSFRAEFYVVGADGRVTSSPVSWNFISNTAN